MEKSVIRDLRAYEILDSRGNPTVAVSMKLADGTVARSGVPSGASTGTHEALELRDGDKKRYRGKGVLKACANANKKILPAIKGMDAADQRKVDQAMIELDGTENKGRLGANAILGVSLAAARAAAQSKRKPLYKHLRSAFRLPPSPFRLPVPLMNIMNGGLHADSDLDIQEFIVIPVSGMAFSKKLQMGVEVFHALGVVLKKAGKDTDVGNEGGYAPNLGSNEKALQMIVEAIKVAGYKPRKDACLGMDVAATEFYNKDKHEYHMPTDKLRTDSRGMIDLMKKWSKKYPICTIEDPLDEEDWDGWVDATRELGKKHVVIGDDFFVTNSERLKKGIRMGAANAILIKVNQIGSLSETMDTIKLAQRNGYKIVISHRSGETCDTTISDLSVAVNAEYIKTGAPDRGERTAKYNRLLEIEHELKR